MLEAKKPKSNIEPISEGVHIGVCNAVVDMGTHHEERWDKDVHKVLIWWEIPAERIKFEDEKTGVVTDKPRVISKNYNLSLHEKADLRKHLEAIRGQKFTKEELEGFDLKHIMGSGAQIQVVHNKKDDKTYANIETIMALPKGQKPAEPENDPLYFSLEEGADIPDSMPEWIVEKITARMEWQAMKKASGENQGGPEVVAPENQEDDSLPF